MDAFLVIGGAKIVVLGIFGTGNRSLNFALIVGSLSTLVSDMVS